MSDTAERYEGKEQMRNLFAKLGIQYIERTLFSEDCLDFMFIEKEKLADYLKHPECYETAIKYYQNKVREKYMATVYVKWISEDVGYGLFASEDIEEGNLIGEYSGVVCLKKQVNNMTWSWKYPIKGTFLEPYDAVTSVNGGELGNELRFANHSDDRNTSPIMVHDGDTWVNCYFARKPIAKDQEITISYGERYWLSRKKIALLNPSS